ncbi:hypothetical protein HD597_000562 [Nonomuraea thailandensis]|uniref:Uncharacterized protein n=1 Tax=Nonomuraea thailandensis TaxID=1188745 RepID=A0A9X2JXW7_9ACTN|nr:hypothetical protein [Nonomuraea thailandensis]MCP2353542.1 hypothetical protein [Nonomuraea thailandensis]
MPGDRATAVRASLDRSYESLPASARRLFRLLPLLPDDDCTPEAVAAMLEGPPHEAEFLLETIVAAHLVRRQAPGRLRAGPLLRLYARERLADEEMSAAQPVSSSWR